MEVTKNEPVTVHRSLDPFWWVLAFVLGVVVLWLPGFLQPDPTGTSRWILVNGAFFFAGALLGSFRPDRAWRWGIGTILPLPISDAAKLVSNPDTAGLTSDQIVNFLLQQGPIYLVQMVPVLAGAYLASYMAGRR